MDTNMYYSHFILKGIILILLLLKMSRFVANSSGVGSQMNIRCLTLICVSNYGENMNC